MSLLTLTWPLANPYPLPKTNPYLVLGWYHPHGSGYDFNYQRVMKDENETMVVFLDSSGIVRQQHNIITTREGRAVPVDIEGRPLVAMRVPTDQLRAMLQEHNPYEQPVDWGVSSGPLFKVAGVTAGVLLLGYCLSWVPTGLTVAGDWLSAAADAGRTFLRAVFEFVVHAVIPLSIGAGLLLLAVRAVLTGGGGAGSNDNDNGPQPPAAPGSGISITTTTTIQWKDGHE